MRAILKKEDLATLFGELKKTTRSSWDKISKIANVSTRTIFDWRRGSVSIPVSFLEIVKNEYGIIHPRPEQIIDENRTKSLSGRLGGLRRNELYGNPGTANGRSLGGKNSVKVQNDNPHSPFKRKFMLVPRPSSDLSEFIGILLGDGGVSTRQINITLHKIDDREYALYIAKLIEKILRLKVTIRERRNENVNIITVSRTDLVDLLNSMGVKSGNKVRNQTGVPRWIEINKQFSLACIRGLFDTDGCVYVDKHIVKGKIYKDLGLNFTNRSLPLLSFFKKVLKQVGLSPTQKTKYSVFLRREKDIVRYFEIVDSSNPKHLGKFRSYFIDKHGRVPKWS